MPGDSFHYQNQAFTLGSFVAARAAGAPYSNQDLPIHYERLMRERLFDAVPMPHTTFSFTKAMQSRNHAWPSQHSAVAGQVTAVQPKLERFLTQVEAAGGVWSNLEDMAQYALLHVNEGINHANESVVSRAALEETHTVSAVLGTNFGYGLGWVVDETSGAKII